MTAALTTTEMIDGAEARIVEMGGAVQGFGEYRMTDFPVVNRFTPGLYIREIFMPAGSFVVSKIHRTEHPYVVLSGRVLVFVDDELGTRWEMVAAPHAGITKPATRRFLAVLEDTVWMTFHATASTDLEEIERELIEPHTNPLLAEGTQ